VGPVRAARPYLLAIEHVPVAVEHGARLEVGEVAPRIGLGEALAPKLLGVEDLAEVPRSLRGGAVLHEGGAEHGDAPAVHGLRRLRPRHLLVEDDLFHDGDAAAAVLRGPVEADVAGLVKGALPLTQPVHLVAIGAGGGEGTAAEVSGYVLGEPGARLGPEPLLLGGEVEVHGVLLRQTRLGSGLVATPLIFHCPLSSTSS